MRGRWPLSSLSNQDPESGVEPGSDWWVDLTVGSPEDVFPVSVVFDNPSVFVEEPVVISAEQDQIVQIGGSTVSPMGPMVGLNEVSGATTGELTATITMPELVTQPGRDQTGTTSDPQHFGVVVDGTFDQRVRRVCGRSRWRSPDHPEPRPPRSPSSR